MSINKSEQKQYFQNEPSRVGKLFLRTLRIIKPGISNDAIRTAAYFRSLDNIVDGVMEPSQSKEIISQEKESVHGIGQAKKNTTERSEVIYDMATKYGLVIAEYSQRLLTNFETDSNLRATHEPLTEEELLQHRVNGSLPVLQFLSTTVYNKELQFGNKMSNYLFTWMTYDHIKDMREDLAVNLNHISREDCHLFGFVGEPSQFPQNQVGHYIDYKREKVLQTIHEDAKGMKDTNLPAHIALAARAYLSSRVAELKKIK